MQKDIADMEAKKAKLERSEIIKRGFVPPQKNFPGSPKPERKASATPPPPPPEPPSPPPKPPEQPSKPPKPPSRPLKKPASSQPPLSIPSRKEQAAQISLPPQKKKGLFAPKILIRVIAIFMVAGGIFGFWFLFIQENGPPQTPPPTSTEEPPPTIEPPSSTNLVKKDSDLDYKLENIEQGTSLVEEVRDILANQLPEEGSLRKLVNLSFSINDGRSLGLDEMLDILGITVPPLLMEEFEDQFMLIHFLQPEGKRLVFVVKVKDASVAETQAGLWETTIVDDTEEFFNLLGKEGVVGPFKSATWRGTSFRYFDLLPEKLGIVYAVHPGQKLFILTSSGDSMIEVINRIQPN